MDACFEFPPEYYSTHRRHAHQEVYRVLDWQCDSRDEQYYKTSACNYNRRHLRPGPAWHWVPVQMPTRDQSSRQVFKVHRAISCQGQLSV